MARTQVQAELIATNAISGTIIADNAITATHIATNSISGTLVQDSGIVTSMIAANNVTSAKIVTDAVLTRHIADDQVTAAKLANSINTDIATGPAALPKAGGAMTGNITSASDFSLDVEADLTLTALSDIVYQTTSTNSTAGHHIFKSFNTEIMRIDGGNNLVGIGTDSPTHHLHVNAGTTNVVAVFESSDNEATIRIKDNTGTAAIKCRNDFRFNKSESTEMMRLNNDGRLLLGTDTSNYEYGGITQITVNPSSWSSGLGIGTQTNASEGDGCGIDFFQKISLSGAKWNTARIGSHAVSVGSSAYGDIRFSTMNATTFSEKMRIIPTGVLCLGDFTPESGDASTPTSIFLEGGECNMVIKNTDATSSSQRQGIAFLNSSGTRVGTITINSSTTGFTHASDYRLKENIDYTWDATTRLKQLKPVRFNWKVDDTNTLVDGFLAHEVSSVVPEAVTGEKDGDEMQGIDQSKLIPLLVKTIQELEARIATLEG